MLNSSRSSFQRVSSRISRCIHNIRQAPHSRTFAVVSSEIHASEKYPPIGTGSAESLRSRPYQFQSDVEFQNTQDGSSLSRSNARLAIAASKGHSRTALDIAQEMKQEGITPNLDTYISLLRSLSNSPDALWAVFDDMVLLGIKPDVRAFNALIEAHHYRDSSYLWPIMRKMEQMGVETNATTYGLIIRYYTQENRFETALRYFNIMKSKGIEPEFRTLKQLVKVAAESGHARLALDLVHSFESESMRKLESDVWINCLTAAASCLWKDGVLECWEYVVQELNLNPDEGLCMSVLHTAARHGLPALATDVIRVLEVIGVPWQEHHFAPLVEAFCNAGQIKEAIVTVDMMRENIPASSTTLLPILDHIKKDIDTFDSTWTLMDEIHKDTPLHVSSLNMIIEAAVRLGDLQRAVGAYKSFPDYNLKPDRSTFHLLLEGCVAASHQALGDLIVKDMKEAEIAPDQRTYELIIDLCLTQDVYEDVFVSLETMKEDNFKPLAGTYSAIVEKCASNGDARYTIALEEMEEMGHAVAPGFLRRVKKLFAEKSSGPQENENVRSTSLDGGAQHSRGIN